MYIIINLFSLNGNSTGFVLIIRMFIIIVIIRISVQLLGSLLAW